MVTLFVLQKNDFVPIWNMIWLCINRVKPFKKYKYLFEICLRGNLVQHNIYVIMGSFKLSLPNLWVRSANFILCTCYPMKRHCTVNVWHNINRPLDFEGTQIQEGCIMIFSSTNIHFSLCKLSNCGTLNILDQDTWFSFNLLLYGVDHIGPHDLPW